MKKQAKIIVGMGAVAVENATTRLTQALFNLAPETAKQVEIKEMENDLDKLLEGVVTQRLESKSFKDEAVAAETMREQRMVAAEEIQDRIKSGNIAGQALQDNENALEELLGFIENDEANIIFLRQRADTSKEILDELQADADQFADQLKNFLVAVERAKTSQQLAELDAKRANGEAERAARLAGLRDRKEDRSSVLNALNQKTEKLRIQAKIAREKAKILTDSGKGEENPIVAKAMANVAGKKVEPEVSLEDRLATLRNK